MDETLISNPPPAYGDEILQAEWVAVPHLETRLETVAVAAPCDAASNFDARGFMAALYAAQE